LYKLFRPFLQRPSFLQRLKKEISTLTILVNSNNIFCTLQNNKKHTLKSVSAGKYQLKVSRKNLLYMLKPVLESFFQEIKMAANKELFIVITSPLRIRKQIIKFLYSKLLKKQKYTIKIEQKKCFGGCRARKKRRKKRKGLRIFKNII
jgi:ribosomal protein S11